MAARYASTGASPSPRAICGLPPERSRGGFVVEGLVVEGLVVEGLVVEGFVLLDFEVEDFVAEVFVFTGVRRAGIGSLHWRRRAAAPRMTMAESATGLIIGRMILR